MSPQVLNNIELNFLDTMFGLYEVYGDRSGIVWIEFLNTSVVFIHPLSDGSFCLSSILIATFSALNDVNNIA